MSAFPAINAVCNSAAARLSIRGVFPVVTGKPRIDGSTNWRSLSRTNRKTSETAIRRCPPAVFSILSKPSSHQRLIDDSLTRTARATCLGLKCSFKMGTPEKIRPERLWLGHHLFSIGNSSRRACEQLATRPLNCCALTRYDRFKPSNEKVACQTV